MAWIAEADGRWRVSIKDTYDGRDATIVSKFVFIGAGGGALPLLQKSKIPEGRGYGGFPVSGIWLRYDVDVRRSTSPCEGLWQGRRGFAADVGAAS